LINLRVKGGRYALWSVRSEGGSASRSGDGSNMDDEAEMRAVAGRDARECGYVVLRAHDAGRSTEHRRTSSRTHPLRLTDVLTPGMNGIMLAERVRLGWPHTKLLTSGVARDNLQTRL